MTTWKIDPNAPKEAVGLDAYIARALFERKQRKADMKIPPITR